MGNRTPPGGMTVNGSNAQPELVRGLGLLDSTFLIMGIVVGSGIFLTTGIMARDLPSPLLLLAAWAVGGFISIAGALTFAELGAAMPEAGGQYIYLRESYGPLPAFLFGWVTFLVYQTGSAAAVAAGFSEYLGFFLPALGSDRVLYQLGICGTTWSLSAAQIVALGAIVLVTAVNVRGVETGSLLNNVLTVTKMLAIAAFAVLGLTIGRGHAFPLALNPEGASPISLLRGFGIGLVAVLWAFDGWNNINFSAGEIRKPERTLPQALFFGTLGITVVYLLVNIAYFYGLPLPELAGEVRVAEKAATALFGPTAATLIVVAVLVATFSATNGTILTGARVYYAMARDGVFFRSVARVHPRYRTPHVSLWWQCLWAGALTLTGSFDRLFTYAMVSALMMFVAAAACIFTLRRKFPDLPRPYKVWGYPLTPALFLVAVMAILVNTLVERPLESLAGLVLMLLGIPVYLLWSRKRRASVVDRG